MNTDNQTSEPSRFKLAIIIVSATLMLFANLFIFVPFEIYHSNTEEFEIGYLQMLFSHWILIALPLLVILFPLLLPRRIARAWGVVIFVLACFTWLQSTVMVWDYGVFDGRGLAFDAFHHLGVLDLILLGALMISAAIFTRKIEAAVIIISWVFIASQLLLMFSIAGTKNNFWIRDFPTLEIPRSLGTISRNQNIFHIVLDSAQSDVFLELVDEAGLRNDFSGFTLFVENAAVAPHTAFGIPSTLTGELYDGSRSPEEFFRDAVTNGFHAKLFDAGWSVNLVPLLPMENGPYTNYFEIPSGYRGSNNDLLQRNTAKLLETALFRVSPHFLRVKIYDGGNWLLSSLFASENSARSFREKTFFKDYIDNLNIGQDGPAYHFIHLMPPHPPYVTLADGTYAGKVLPSNRENFLNEMRPMVQLLIEFINRLETLGVYKDSAIVIQGDHGSGIPAVANGQPVTPCVPRLPALLAIKTPGNTEALIVSTAMTTLLDIAATTLNLAARGEESVFQIDPTTSRRRDYFLYDDNSITKYWIEGSVYDDQSCIKVGSKEIEQVREFYSMGKKINFGVQGQGSTITAYGWGPQLNGHSWSKANEAALKVLLQDKDLHTNLELELTFRAFTHKQKLPSQHIRIRVNGILVEEWTEQTRKIQQRRVLIPADAVDGNELKIVFEFPDAASPRSLGLGADAKKLGIALRAVQLSTARP